MEKQELKMKIQIMLRMKGFAPPAANRYAHAIGDMLPGHRDMTEDHKLLKQELNDIADTLRLVSDGI